MTEVMESDQVTEQFKALLNWLNSKEPQGLSTILSSFLLKFRASFKQNYLAPPLKAIF
jgi:hypothetical protein